MTETSEAYAIYLQREFNRVRYMLDKAYENPMIVIEAPPALEVHYDFKSNPMYQRQINSCYVNAKPFPEFIMETLQMLDKLSAEITRLMNTNTELQNEKESLERSNGRLAHKLNTAKDKMRAQLNQAVDNL